MSQRPNWDINADHQLESLNIADHIEAEKTRNITERKNKKKTVKQLMC